MSAFKTFGFTKESGGASTFETITGDPMDNEELSDKLDEKLNADKVLRAYQAADIIYNNTITLADTGITFPVEAGGTYRIDLFIFGNCAVRGLRYAFGGTATITEFIADWIADNANSPGTDFTGARTEAANTEAVLGTMDVVRTEVIGSVKINAAGTFVLQSAQSTLDASDSIFLRGSNGILTKLN